MEKQRRYRMAKGRASKVIRLLVLVVTLSVLLALVGSPGVLGAGCWVFEIFKYEDLDKNGQWDAGEPGLEGWEFTLTGPGCCEQKTTDANGMISFTPVCQLGAFSVCETLKPGWVNSEPGGGKLCEDRLIIAPPDPPDQNFISLQFGNYPQAVGGVTQPGRGLALLAPWLGLGALALGVAGALVARRRGRASTG
jgi:hypothetical protein